MTHGCSRSGCLARMVAARRILIPRGWGFPRGAVAPPGGIAPRSNHVPSGGLSAPRPLRGAVLLLLAIAVHTAAAAGQTAPPDTVWTRTYGGGNIDITHDVRVASDGGFILTGYTRSSGAGGRDLWLIKTDPAGAVDWDQTFGGGDDDEGHAICQSADGGFLAAGYTSSFGAGGTDVWLVKTDAAGAQEWAETFGGPQDDEAYAAQAMPDGGWIVAGVTSSFAMGGRDVWLIRTDEDGTHLWDRTLGGYGSDGAWSIGLTSDGGFILAGWTFSSGPGYLGNAWLVKTDSLGVVEWDQAFGGQDADRGFAARQTPDGGYIMAGYTGSSGAGLYDLYLVKTDGAGTLEWSRTFGGTGRDYGQAVVPATGGGFLAAGYTLSYGAGGEDVYLVRTDADGNLVWDATCGGTASDVGYAITTTPDEGYLIAAHTLSYGAGLHDAWAIRLAPEDSPAAVSPPERAPHLTVRAGPNPFTRSVTIRYALAGGSRVLAPNSGAAPSILAAFGRSPGLLSIHDASGRLVRVLGAAHASEGTGTVVWDGRSQGGARVPPGVYFGRLEAGRLRGTLKLLRTE